MQAMVLRKLGPMIEGGEPLHAEDWPEPEPQADEVLLRVLCCGVCHTELDEVEGRLPPAFLPIIPGHQVVGEIIATGSAVPVDRIGKRVGVGWIYRGDGSARENLSPLFRATGKDAHGGYAQFMVVPHSYAFTLPDHLAPEECAPLLCAGSIGYRALRLCNIADGEPLGLMGFGSSGHLVLQMARVMLPHSPVYVFSHTEAGRQFAMRRGADWVGAIEEKPKLAPAAIIDTTPAWKPIISALRVLKPGGKLVINAIRKESLDQSTLLQLNYHEDLWMEKQIQSVANITGQDIREFLQLVHLAPMKPTVTKYPLHEANRALCDVKFGRLQGSAVLIVSP